MVNKFYQTIVCAAFFGLLLSSCGNTGPTNNSSQPSASALPDDVDALQKQVMKIHEQTMIRMDSVMMLKKTFREMEQAKLTSPAVADAAVAENLQKLQKADNDMTDWMHQYKAPDKKENHDKAIAYLNGQLSQIKQVQKELDASFSSSDSLLTILKH